MIIVNNNSCIVYITHLQVHRKTLNPLFKETLVFKNIPYSEITNRTLCIELYDFDRFSRHDIIGEAKLALIDVDLANNIDEWRALIPPSSAGGLHGVSLKIQFDTSCSLSDYNKLTWSGQTLPNGRGWLHKTPPMRLTLRKKYISLLELK